MNATVKYFYGLHNWDSLTEEYNKNVEMVPSEPSAGCIQKHIIHHLVTLNSFKPARWQLF